MAQRMACASGDPAVDTRGVRLAGVASYAGVDPGLLPASCGQGGRPAPARVLAHGLDGQVISPQQLGFPAFQAWAARFGCHPAAGSYTRPQHLNGCQQGAAVAWWPLPGLGHLNWSCPADRFWHNRWIWRFLTTGAAPKCTTCS